jgi:hypothetical protein
MCDRVDITQTTLLRSCICIYDVNIVFVHLEQNFDPRANLMYCVPESCTGNLFRTIPDPEVAGKVLLSFTLLTSAPTSQYRCLHVQRIDIQYYSKTVAN